MSTTLPDEHSPVKNGKKSVRWDKDPEILQRLTTVAELMIRGAKLWQIAEAMQYHLNTAHKDCQRVKELWKREAASTIEGSKTQAIATLRLIQTKAWTKFDKASDPRFLNVIANVEDQIAKITGTYAPIKVEDVSKMSDEEIKAYLVGLAKKEGLDETDRT